MAKNRPAKKDNNKEKKGKKDKGVGKRMKKEAMIQAIISVFQSSPKEPFNYKQISKIIGVENQVQKSLASSQLHKVLLKFPSKLTVIPISFAVFRQVRISSLQLFPRAGVIPLK